MLVIYLLPDTSVPEFPSSPLALRTPFNAISVTAPTKFLHCAQVLGVAFSLGSGQYVATASRDFTARVWPLMGGPPLAELRDQDNRNMCCLDLSGEGSRAVAGLDNHTVCVWEWSAVRVPVSLLRGHSGLIFSVRLSPDNTKASRCISLCLSIYQFG